MLSRVTICLSRLTHQLEDFWLLGNSWSLTLISRVQLWELVCDRHRLLRKYCPKQAMILYIRLTVVVFSCSCCQLPGLTLRYLIGDQSGTLQVLTLAKTGPKVTDLRLDPVGEVTIRWRRWPGEYDCNYCFEIRYLHQPVSSHLVSKSFSSDQPREIRYLWSWRTNRQVSLSWTPCQAWLPSQTFAFLI